MEPTERIAREFSAGLLEQIGPQKLARAVEINRANRGEKWCASHNYCDANMVMLPTIAEVLGVTEDSFIDHVADDEALCDLWNTAWDMAKANDFYTEEQ